MPRTQLAVAVLLFIASLFAFVLVLLWLGHATR